MRGDDASLSKKSGQWSAHAWPEILALLLYSITVALAIRFHEPWADEAQAWQLARNLSLYDLFHTYIRYEGTPGLWYVLLRFFIRFHVSYTGLHWICGAVATASVGLLIFYAPIPRYLRLSLPFTYFLLFQYAVVARSYVLVPGLLFLVALFWYRNSLAVWVLLGILMNVSLHAAVIAGGLAVVFAIEYAQSGERREQAGKQAFFSGMLVCGLMAAFAIWTVLPPHDVDLSRVRGDSREFIWSGMASLVGGVCQPWPLSLIFWGLFGVWLFRSGRGLLLLPIALFAALSGALYANWWHMGLLIPLTITLLWIACEGGACDRPGYRPVIVAMVTLCITQVGWSAYALHYDYKFNYSPDRETAAFLRPLVQRGGAIAITDTAQPRGNQAFDGVGILPYFDHNIYVNQPDPFWSWSSTNPTERQFAAALANRPAVALVEVRIYRGKTLPGAGDPRIAPILAAGYKLVQQFCGGRPERFSVPYRTCHLVYQPVQ